MQRGLWRSYPPDHRALQISACSLSAHTLFQPMKRLRAGGASLLTLEYGETIRERLIPKKPNTHLLPNLFLCLQFKIEEAAIGIQ